MIGIWTIAALSAVPMTMATISAAIASPAVTAKLVTKMPLERP